MNKKIVISSVAVFAAVVLVGCGSDASEQAKKEAVQQKEQAQEAVQDANKNYETEKQAAQEEMAENREAVKQDVAEGIENMVETKVDAAKSVNKQDQEALKQVAQAAGAQMTVAILETYKIKAAKSVGADAVATSIENTTKNNAAFVVTVTQGTDTYEVYMDVNGNILQTVKK
jgi:hypothetical protein